MVGNNILARYLDALLKGDRTLCRKVIEEALQSGIPANAVYADLIWPIMIEIEQLKRGDRITSVQEHLATRINRTIVDQLQNKLPRRPGKAKKIVVSCAQDELQELGAQMAADLFESDGWEVKFVGGGLTNDDILAFVNDYAPDILLVYGTAPKQAPDVRRLIDRVKAVNAWPNMRIMLSGGVFNRAEGLWEEIGADLFAETAVKALQAASANPTTESQPRQDNSSRRRKHRQPPVCAPALV
ncbi:MAG TPA: cobalamin-dependent protein [Sedimentisphaerales bacterium]|nr:cobalamin-dependent protein [Sedimentisphaerales bacterium]